MSVSISSGGFDGLLGKPYLDGLFSLGKAATMGCCLSLHFRYEIVALLGLILTEKRF